MTTMALKLQAALVAVALAACGSAPQRLTQQQLGRLQTIEVSIDVPRGNYVYTREDDTLYMPSRPGASGGGSSGAAVGAGILVVLVLAGLTQLKGPMAVEKEPVGESVKDLDLRSMAFAHLRTMADAAGNGPRIALSTEPFPDMSPAPVPQAEIGAPPGSTPRREPLNPLQPLIDRAKASKADAMLFVALAPTFRNGKAVGADVRIAASLYDRSGALLQSLVINAMGPLPPGFNRREAVQFYADGRFRRLVAQGVRGAMVHLGEGLFKPALVAERQAEMERVLEAQPYEEKRDPTGHQVGRDVPRAQESAANAARMRSTASALSSDDQPIVYRYERPARSDTIAVAAYCPGEQLDLWSQSLVPGMSWLTEPLPQPALSHASGK
jgi:hypothetical protein